MIEGLSTSDKGGLTSTIDNSNRTSHRCGCHCNCPESRLNCRCKCECPVPYSGPLYRGLCAPGFTKVCPYQLIGCPNNMEKVCRREIIDHIHGRTPSRKSKSTTTDMPMTVKTTPKPTAPSFILTKLTKTFTVRKNKFTCTFWLTHYYEIVERAFARCNPKLPKNQKALRLKLSGNGYTFQVNMHINPTKINVAKIIDAPPTTAPVTTTTSTTTTTTLSPFNENSCDCVADFLLLLYSIPHFDRSLNEELHVGWTVTSRKKAHSKKDYSGSYTSEHSMPQSLNSGCYCVQQDENTESAEVKSTATTGITATTAWTPGTTQTTEEQTQQT